MKPVFQRLFEPGKGDCTQAAVASLLEMEYEDVPHFSLLYGMQWVNYLDKFLEEHGYEIKHDMRNAWKPIGTQTCIKGFIKRYENMSMRNRLGMDRNRETHWNAMRQIQNKCDLENNSPKLHIAQNTPS